MTSKEALQIIRYCYDEEAYETYYDLKPATYKLKIDGDNVSVEKEKENDN